MWMETIIREETGCAAYMIGCDGTNECMVFDPLWDIQPYLDMAEKKGSRIKYIIDSHSHADHVSGGRRLREATGAELILPVLADFSMASITWSRMPSWIAASIFTLGRKSTTYSAPRYNSV